MIFNTIGTLTYLICQWLNTFIVARISGFEAAGIFALALSYTNMLYILASYSMRGYQVSDTSLSYTTGIYLGSRIATVAITLGICVVILLFSSYDEMQKHAILLYTAFRLIEAFVDVIYGIFYKLQRTDIICISFVFRGIGSTAVFGLILHFLDSLHLAFISMTICSILVMIAIDLFQANKLDTIKPSFKKNQIKGLLVTCFPLVVCSFLAVLSSIVPRLFIERILGSEQLGFFASVSAPTLIVQAAAGFVVVPLVVVFARYYMKKQYKRFTVLFMKCTLSICAFASLGIIGAYFLGEVGLTFLFGEEIIPYEYLLAPMIITSALAGMQILASQTSTIIRDFRGLIISGVVGVIISFLFSPYFIEKQGLNGGNNVAIISLLLQILALILFALLKLRKERSNSFG